MWVGRVIWVGKCCTWARCGGRGAPDAHPARPAPRGPAAWVRPAPGPHGARGDTHLIRRGAAVRQGRGNSPLHPLRIRQVAQPPEPVAQRGRGKEGSGLRSWGCACALGVPGGVWAAWRAVCASGALSRLRPRLRAAWCWSTPHERRVLLSPFSGSPNVAGRAAPQQSHP